MIKIHIGDISILLSSFTRLYYKILCKIFGHKLHVEKRFSATNRKVYCSRCKKYFGMNDSAQAFIEWDGDLEAASKYF